MNFVNNGTDDLILESLSKSVKPTDDLVKSLGRQGLVQKEITDKNEHRRKVWVRAEQKN